MTIVGDIERAVTELKELFDPVFTAFEMGASPPLPTTRIVSNPSDGLIQVCYYKLSDARESWPEVFKSVSAWNAYWIGSDDHAFHPVVITQGGDPVAIIAFTGQRHAPNTVECHFIAIAPRNPIAVVRSVRNLFDMIGDEQAVDLIYGHIFQTNAKAIRTAKLFGFKCFANSADMWYSAKIINPR